MDSCWRVDICVPTREGDAMSEHENAGDTPAATVAAPSNAAKLVKGCGCTTAVVVLATGILVIGHFDASAWASALTAIIIVVLVFNLSGTNGFWEK